MPPAVYCGRPGTFGNPFKLGLDGDRQQVILKFEQRLDKIKANSPKAYEWLLAQLRGKDLVCWCAPKSCHCDILLERANRKID